MSKTTEPTYSQAWDKSSRTWVPGVLKKMTCFDWEEWVRLRLCWHDDLFGYGGDEFDSTAQVFESVSEFCKKEKIALTQAGRGAELFLRRILNEKVQDVRIIENAIRAANILHTEEDRCDEEVANRIRQNLDNFEVTRYSLYVLSVLEKRGSRKFLDIWENYFRQILGEPYPFYYVLVAFVGISKSKGGVYEEDLKKLQKYCSMSQKIPIQAAHLATKDLPYFPSTYEDQGKRR